MIVCDGVHTETRTDELSARTGLESFVELKRQKALNRASVTEICNLKRTSGEDPAAVT